MLIDLSLFFKKEKNAYFAFRKCNLSVSGRELLAGRRGKQPVQRRLPPRRLSSTVRGQWRRAAERVWRSLRPRFGPGIERPSAE